MRVWRIAAEKYARDRSGVGAWRDGGRWNSKGFHAIYLGTSPEICSLEKLAHSGRPFPKNLMLVSADLPDDAELYLRPDRNKLPKGWNQLPPSASSAKFGDRILAEGKFLGFFVPSVLMPETDNLVLNPSHPAMAQVEFALVRKFEFDPRI